MATKDFATFTPSTGSNNGTVSVTVSSNTGEARSISLSIKGQGITKTISINQDKVASLVNKTIVIRLGNVFYEGIIYTDAISTSRQIVVKLKRIVNISPENLGYYGISSIEDLSSTDINSLMGNLTNFYLGGEVIPSSKVTVSGGGWFYNPSSSSNQSRIVTFGSQDFLVGTFTQVMIQTDTLMMLVEGDDNSMEGLLCCAFYFGNVAITSDANRPLRFTSENVADINYISFRGKNIPSYQSLQGIILGGRTIMINKALNTVGDQYRKIVQIDSQSGNQIASMIEGVKTGGNISVTFRFNNGQESFVLSNHQ